MKGSIDSRNVFGPTPKGLVFEALKSLGSKRHLDFGTYDGEAVKVFAEAGLVDSAIGIDANREVLLANTNRMPPNVELKVVPTKAALEFSDGQFDSVSAIGVIEHIADQGAVLREFYRVLKSGGHLIVAVPGKHLFSFLDMGNFKFIFPTLHRLAYTFFNSAEQYRARYIECRNGLFGDIEKEKMWHEHFSVKELERLLGQYGFKLVDVNGLGFFRRAINDIGYFIPGPLRSLFRRMEELDAKIFNSAELVVVARKGA